MSPPLHPHAFGFLAGTSLVLWMGGFLVLGKLHAHPDTQVTGTNNGRFRVGHWLGYATVYSAPGVIFASTPTVEHGFLQSPGNETEVVQGPSSLFGTRWWGASTLNTRLTSKVKAINNTGIMVGQINDYVSTNPPQSDTMSWPKAVAWMSDGTCFMLDEIIALSSDSWLSDAVAINDDNIVVATLQTPNGAKTVALRLPIIP